MHMYERRSMLCVLPPLRLYALIFFMQKAYLTTTENRLKVHSLAHGHTQAPLSFP